MKFRIICAVSMSFVCGSNCARSDDWTGSVFAAFLAFLLLLSALQRTEPRPRTWHYKGPACDDCSHKFCVCDRCDDCTVTPSGFEP